MKLIFILIALSFNSARAERWALTMKDFRATVLGLESPMSSVVVVHNPRFIIERKNRSPQEIGIVEGNARALCQLLGLKPAQDGLTLSPVTRDHDFVVFENSRPFHLTGHEKDMHRLSLWRGPGSNPGKIAQLRCVKV
jgi:hypothetical protein